MASSEEQLAEFRKLQQLQQFRALSQEKKQPPSTAGAFARDTLRMGPVGLKESLEFIGEIGKRSPHVAMMRGLGILPSDEQLAEQTPEFVKDIGRKVEGALEYEVPEGESDLFDTVRTVGEFAGGSLMPGGTGKQILKTAATTGLGAGAGQGLVQAMGGTEAGEDVGAIAGAVSTGLPGLFRAMGRKFFPGTQRKAEETLSELIPEEIQLQEGPGTLATRSGSREAAATEQMLARGGPQEGREDFRHALAAADEAVMQKSRDVLTSDISGDAAKLLREEAAQTLETGVSQAKETGRGLKRAKIAEIRQQRQAQADKMAGELEDTVRQHNLSRDDFNRMIINEAAPPGITIDAIGSEGFNHLKGAYDSGYDQIWMRVNALPENAVAAAQQATNEALRRVAGNDKAILKTSLKDIKEVAQNPSPAAIRELDSQLRNKIQSAASGGANQYELMEGLKEMRKGIRENLDVADDLRSLDDRYDGFLTVRNAIARADGGAFSEKDLASAAFKIGGEARVAAGTQPFAQSMRQRQPVVAQQEAQLGAQKSQQQLQAEMLRERQAEQMAGVREAATQEVSQAQRAPIGQVAGFEDPVEGFGKLVRSGTPAESMEAAFRTISPENRATAVAALKQVVGESIGNERNLKKALSAARRVLPESEFAQVQQAVRDAERIAIRKGIDVKQIPPAKRTIMTVLASWVGAGAGAKLLPGAASLKGASAGARGAEYLFEGLPHKRVLQRMRDIMAHPEDYPEAIERINALKRKETITAAERSQFWKTLLATTGGEDQEE